MLMVLAKLEELKMGGVTFNNFQGRRVEILVQLTVVQGYFSPREVVQGYFSQRDSCPKFL